MNATQIATNSLLALIFSLIFIASTWLASAQSIQPIYSFAQGPNFPQGNLVLGPDGNLYGTTSQGGSGGIGTVFEVSTNNGALTMLDSFSKTNGSSPAAGLTLGPDGNLYGTTERGGTTNFGTVFRVSTNGTLITLVNFVNSNGANPEAGLTLGPDGNFYGTTYSGMKGIAPKFGATDGYGTFFEMSTNGTLTTLASFANTNGASPQASLTLGPDGNFYGTTYGGGISNKGTVFMITTNGAITSLASFAITNGEYPTAGVTPGPDGNLYGMTPEGGANGYGTVFQVTTNGTLTTLINFDKTNGAYPDGGLTLGPDGNFYGATEKGGTNNFGTVFEITTNGVLTTLFECAATNGSSPESLTLGPDGNFYGTTAQDVNGFGAVFEMTTNGALTTLVSFLSDEYPNGEEPEGLTLGPDGNFYSTTYQGGNDNYGTAFKITTSGAESTLFSFDWTNGAFPDGLILGPDDNFYGTTQNGGTNGSGILFKMNTDGVMTPLSDFVPQGLTLGPDGNFYGTTLSTNSWTLFEMATNGAFSPLFTFADTNGENPHSLTLGPDGNFYGTTADTIFEVTTNGTLNTVADFGFAANPSELTLGPDGSFYGTSDYTTNTGGPTFFRVTMNGIMALAVFTNAEPGGLTLGPDGNFYGITSQGGNNNAGTLFKATINGVLTTLASFAITNGENPGPLTLGPDGNFYGTTGFGGVSGRGVIYRLNLPPDFSQQPTDQSVASGSTATFSATPFGTAPFSFQWFSNNIPIAGATESTLTIPNVTIADAEGYSVLVANGWGSVTSSVAELTVNLEATNFNVSIRNGTVAMADFTGSGGAVSIPASVDGLPVTSIGAGAFARSSVTSVAIPETVTTIGAGAFSNCLSLTNVTIGNGVGSIGDNAFANSGLVSVTIPDNVTNLGNGTFYGCDALTSVTLGNGITSIGNNDFYDCDALNGITIPDSVTAIGTNAFLGCIELTNAVIGDGVTNIFDGAFESCSGLGGIYFEGDAPSLGTNVFAGVGDPPTAYYLPGTTGWGTTCGGLPTAEFYYLINIENGAVAITGYDGPAGAATIPDALNGQPVTSIEPDAFFDTGVTNVMVPDSVTNIADNAFAQCSSLADVYFNGNAPGLGTNVFAGDTATIYYLPGTTGWQNFDSESGLNSATEWPSSGYNVVCSLNDNGPGTLRTAIGIDNNDATITFATNLAGATITLSTTLVINQSLTIDASGLPNGIQLNGSGTVQIMNVFSNNTVVLSHIALVSGNSSSGGGGVYNGGTLTMHNCTVINNLATAGSEGGGIYNSSVLTLDRCIIAGNSTTGLAETGIDVYGANGDDATGGQAFGGDSYGGGIYNIGSMHLDYCTLSNNSATGGEGAGGNGYGADQYTWGFFNSVGPGTGYGGTGYGGTGYGGGIGNFGSLTLNCCTLSNNSANGGIGLGGSGTGGSPVVLGASGANGYGGNGHGGIGFGGGIANAGTVSMNGCTLSGNSVGVGQCFAGAGYGGEFGGQGYWGGITAGYSFGGGIDTVGNLMMSQCTLSGNNAWNQGGGIYCINSTNTLCNCTVSENSAYYESGGGIYQSETYPGIVALTNTIVAANNAPSDADISSPAALLITAFSLTNGDPLLAPLGNHGGPTQTMPPLPGSPAIAAGNLAANTFTNDQRGYPRTFNGLIDIGAVEVPVIQQWTATPTNTPVGSPVQFSGPTVDSDGSVITQWSWNFGDGAPGTGEDTSHPYMALGGFSPNLTVTDSLGLTLAPSGPFITTFYFFTVSPTNGYMPLTVQFNCPGIDPSGNLITNWTWNFGDGATSTNNNPTHIYTRTGSFIPYLVALDNQGEQVESSGPPITVTAAPTITAIVASAGNLSFRGSNGLAGFTYEVLSSTNLALPLSQWTPVTTNSWTLNGNFNFTITNTVSPSVQQRYYILQVQ